MIYNSTVLIVAAAVSNRTVVIPLPRPLSQSTSSRLIVESNLVATIGWRPIVEKAIRIDNDTEYSAALIFRKVLLSSATAAADGHRSSANNTVNDGVA
jgi:hypothetical protein